MGAFQRPNQNKAYVETMNGMWSGGNGTPKRDEMMEVNAVRKIKKRVATCSVNGGSPGRARIAGAKSAAPKSSRGYDS